jgi:NAD(P)-dependent dehydrogenase (short-subunit alcohol dehydrogenase family)
VNARVAVITGGAGGLGQALNAGLRARGWRTVLVDLPSPALESLAGDGTTVHACDLTDSAALALVCRQIEVDHPAIDLVVYNAGVTWIGAFDDLTEAAHRRVFDINYFAAATMARNLRESVRKARGTHLAISSVAGFSPLVRRTAYAASKHALEGFFKSLRSEERPRGVRCVIAAPSFVATNLGNAGTRADGTARPGSAPDGVDYMTPEAAAAAILRGLDAGHETIPVGRVARLSWYVYRFSPRLFARIMERRIG